MAFRRRLSIDSSSERITASRPPPPAIPIREAGNNRSRRLSGLVPRWTSPPAVKDGQFCRVRYTGKSAPMPVGYRVVKTGVELTFSEPLDKKSAEDDDNWAGIWTGVLKKVPNAKEKQEMPITAVRLAEDRKTV